MLLLVRTGKSLRPERTPGEPFMRTVYSVSPNLTVPEGKIKFCVFTALTTSAGASPRACKASMSKSTEITLTLPP